MPPQTLLKVPDVAARLNVSRKTIVNYCEAKIFPNAFKLGESRTSPWRIPQSDVDAYLRQQKRAQTSVKA